MGTMQRRKRDAMLAAQTPWARHGALVASYLTLFAEIAKNQQPLGPEFEAIWDANTDKLYEP